MVKHSPIAVGERFGRLATLERGLPDKRGRPAYVMKCDCGQVTVAVAHDLRGGKTKSCGCLWLEQKVKNGNRKARHGHARKKTGASPEYTTWSSMKRRCESPVAKNYCWYGARGIRVCERWRNSFENFLADMGPRPSPGHSIDRIDPNGHYEPPNCRWADHLTQRHNRRPKAPAQQTTAN